MGRFTFHVFVCTNRRPPDSPKGSCGEKGSERTFALLKEGVHQRGLSGKVKVSNSGCLSACPHGPSIVVYPEGVWYGRVRPEDVEEIIEEHLVKGTPVERLRIREF
jgi:(2Fe-2S) ferredoxin